MNTLRKTLMISLAVIGLGGAALGAQAQDKPQDKTAPRAERQHEGPGKFAERMAERRVKQQTRLHDKLKLSAAQEPAWTTFTTAMTPKMPAHRPERGEFAKLTAPERMEKHIAMQKERAANQENRLAALKTFYAALTPEQKKVFDDSVPGGQHGGHPGDHRGGRGHFGHGG